MTILASLNMTTLHKGDTFTAPDDGQSYTMQSDRATRRGCKFCHQGQSTEDRANGNGVWWASPVSDPAKWTLVNRDGSTHKSTCPHSGSEVKNVPVAYATKPEYKGDLADSKWETMTPLQIQTLSHDAAIKDADVIHWTRESVDGVGSGAAKIRAIKRYRTLTGCNLYEGKTAIEKLSRDMAADDAYQADKAASESPSAVPGMVASNAPLPEMAAEDSAKVKMLLELFSKPQITPEQIKTMVDYAVDANNKLMMDAVSQVVSDAKEQLRKDLTAPLVVKFEQAAGTPDVTIEHAHADLPDIVAALRTGLNVFMVGMAGTGKTTLAKHAADALGIDFYDISLSPDAGRHLLMGYQTADGTFIPTSLYDAFTKGGLFHFDECDNSNPGLITVVNQVLSHGYIRFADGHMVTKHPDFKAMASGNTYGNGPTADYVGRQPLDGAFKNRWIMVTIMVDETVEEAMCQSTGANDSIVSEVLRYVRALRASATEQGMHLLYTPRNSEHLCKLLHAGWKIDKAVDSAVRMGASDTDWRKVHKSDQGTNAIRKFGIN